MSSSKLSTVGHRCVGELANFRSDSRCRRVKVNMDADTLFRLPLDINKYVAECKAAQRQDIAWVATLNLSQGNSEPDSRGPLPTISHNEFVRRMDKAIGELIRLKEANTVLTSNDRRGASGPLIRKVMHEWGKLHLDNGLLYRKTCQRRQLSELREFLSWQGTGFTGPINEERHRKACNPTVPLYKAKEAGYTPRAPIGSITTSSPLELVSIDYMYLEVS